MKTINPNLARVFKAVYNFNNKIAAIESLRNDNINTARIKYNLSDHEFGMLYSQWQLENK